MLRGMFPTLRDGLQRECRMLSKKNGILFNTGRFLALLTTVVHVADPGVLRVSDYNTAVSFSFVNISSS